MILLFLIGCTDPDFGQVGQALEAYDRGMLSIQQGDSASAADAFAEAIRLDPSRSVLRIWEVEALRRAGESGRAISRLNEGLSRFPADAAMRYQRAALLAQSGNLAGSAADLRWLYAHDAAHPILVGEDANFLPLKTDPLYSELVPDALVDASVKGENGSVLVGDTYALEFEITSRTGVPIHLDNKGEQLEPLVLQRIVEDVVSKDEIWTRRLVRAEYRAAHAGRIAAGPWLVKAGSGRALTERLVVDVVSLPGQRDLDTPKAITIQVPSTRWQADRLPLFSGDVDGDWAVFSSGMVLSPESAKRGPRMEYREEGQPLWSAHLIHGEVGVEVRQNGASVLPWRPRG